MPVYHALSPAKINFTLEIVGRRPDGFHDLRMLMQTIALSDTLTLSIAPGHGVSLRTSSASLPTDQTNLAVRAALFFLEAARLDAAIALHLDKRIPVGAGLGGGSSNAACVLKTLNEHFQYPLDEDTMAALALRLGSDIPFFLRGGLQYAQGRGERLIPLPPLPPCYLVLCKPDYGIATAQAFHTYAHGGFVPPAPLTVQALQAAQHKDLPALGQSLFNQLEPALSALHQADQAAIHAVFQKHGALGDALSGSGPTHFGLFADESHAQNAAETLSKQWNHVFFTRPV